MKPRNAILVAVAAAATLTAAVHLQAETKLSAAELDSVTAGVPVRLPNFVLRNFYPFAPTRPSGVRLSVHRPYNWLELRGLGPTTTTLPHKWELITPTRIRINP